MEKQLVLIGGGRFAEEIAEVAGQIGFSVIGYVDAKATDSSLSYLGDDSQLSTLSANTNVFPAIGSVDRRSLARRVNLLSSISHDRVPTLVSRHSYVSSSATISAGCFIAHGVVVNAFANISEGVVINSNSTIGHDVQVGRHSVISGNVFIGGGTSIGNRVLIGPGANILQGLTIGDDSIISIGSTIVRNVDSNRISLPVFPTLKKIK